MKLLEAIVGVFRGSGSPAAARPSTSVMVGRLQLVAGYSAITGDDTYAQVNSAWLKEFYQTFRQELFRQGVVKGDERFDCNHFASYYVALAQTRFYLSNWNTWQAPQTLAIGFVWYRRRTGIRHAIVVAVTERGTLYIEPQTGAELELNESELHSINLTFFP